MQPFVPIPSPVAVGATILFGEGVARNWGEGTV
ncbi:hypothetical protein IX327_001433 [Porphyromonas levii]|nr:hypothetical protein [Porphyromonas levii]